MNPGPNPPMSYVETNEQKRLNAARETVGHGSRRLQPGRERVELLHS